MSAHTGRPDCACAECAIIDEDIDRYVLERPTELKRTKVGEQHAVLMTNGKVHLQGPNLMTRPLNGLSKEDVQDLLVALDGVTNDMPDRPMLERCATLYDTIVQAAGQLSREIHRTTGHPALVDVELVPEVFEALVGQIRPTSTEIARASRRGTLRFSPCPGVEISVSRCDLRSR